MKSSIIHVFSFVAIASMAMIAMPAGATVLYYDVVSNHGWFADNAWSLDAPGEDPQNFNQTWIAGASAVIPEPAGTIVLNQTAVLNNLTLNATTLAGDAVTPRYLTFDGGDWTVTGFSQIGGWLTMQGDYTLKGGGQLRVGNNPSGWGDAIQYDGTATIENVTVEYFRPDLLFNENSNFVVAGGTLHMGSRSTDTARLDAVMGMLTVNSGTFQMGRSATSTSPFDFTVSSLSGTGGIVRSLGNGGVHVFIVDQEVNTSFAGSILGAQDAARTELQKTGTGELSLSGQIDLRRTTTVSEGRLYINSTNTAFSDEENSTAILVAGGTLGGTGTITVGEDDNVVLAAGGKLAAGLEGSAGRTTYVLDGGVLDLSAATANASTGWLKFDLGSDEEAGTTYDQILITSGKLDITGGLDFDAFAFNLLSGFAPGTYVLIDAPAGIEGPLGITTGTVGGYDATLSFNSPSLVLTVIPEPGSVALLLAGAALVGIARRRRG